MEFRYLQFPLSMLIHRIIRILICSRPFLIKVENQGKPNVIIDYSDKYICKIQIYTQTSQKYTMDPRISILLKTNKDYS